MTQFNERVTIYQYMDATLNHQNKAEIERKSTIIDNKESWLSSGFPPKAKRPWIVKAEF